MAERRISLIDGLTLARRGDSYILGNRTRSLEISPGFEYAAVRALARGEDPADASSQFASSQFTSSQYARLVHRLHHLNFLITERKSLAMPQRYLQAVTERDVSAHQMLDRAQPELLQAQWIDGRSDGGATTIGARAHSHIALSGRSRTITLLHTILLSSGVSAISSADFDDQPLITNHDIGVAGITPTDIGKSYYQYTDQLRRQLALSPTSRSQKRDQSQSAPHLVIHYGSPTPDLVADWMTAGLPHLVISPPFGDHCTIGPLVIPGKTPCLRCLSLFEIDCNGWSSFAAEPLTPISELPMHIAHTVAGIVASIALHWIDSQSDQIERERLTLIGEFLDLDFQRSVHPQVVAISRHPLCGCHFLES